ncbi:hypothetical protein [Blackfly microvirus SF02]|uniref:Uncharacterized protein n=1 Tax=Blackfly microvirus SF02 TaxID=2576452 RepID=A0A4P8PSV9_9VIRU|nr:hypothetical protein [Blackfly microvirus SF02]
MTKTIPGVPVGDFVEEFNTKPSYDEDGVQSSSGIGKDGKEYPDPQPMSPPIGLKPPEDLMTTIRRIVRHEAFIKAADELGVDTFEEAGDYEIENDHEWTDELTPYEAVFYPPDEKPTPSHVKTEQHVQPEVTTTSANQPPIPTEKPTNSSTST